MIAKRTSHRPGTDRLARGLAATLVLGFVTPGLARASDFPAAGQASFDHYVTASVVDSGATSVRRGIAFTDVAISRNLGGEGGFWNDFVDRCAGQFTMLGEEVTHGSGTCVKRDRGGDAVFVTWQGEDWTIVGGTGKYRGITGAGTTSVNPGRDQLHGRPDGWVSVVHHTVRWQIDPARASRHAPLPGMANAGLGG